MANELSNATKLMGDATFRDWMRAAIVYQSRQVILEASSVADHADRLWLANVCVVYPDQHLNLFVNAIACDPAVASLGTIVGTDISQTVILTKIADVWTTMAKLLITPPPG